MRVLTNQILFQCEYCSKRFITKGGAKKHETIYCYLSPISKQTRLNKIKACNHLFEMQYSPMAGESHLLEPSHEECVKCGVHEREWRKINEVNV